VARGMDTSLTRARGACTLANEHGSVIPECPYQPPHYPVIPPSKPHDPARARTLFWGTAVPSIEKMPRKTSNKICVALLLLTFFAAASYAQAPVPLPKPRPAPATATTIDTSEAMFTTMCALYAAGYEGDVNPDNWSTYRAQMREKLRAQQGPAVDALKEYYRVHQLRDPGAMLSRFVWFGLVSGPAPKFRPVLRREELPPDVLDL
jgi:hypothetical protein